MVRVRPQKHRASTALPHWSHLRRREAAGRAQRGQLYPYGQVPAVDDRCRDRVPRGATSGRLRALREIRVRSSVLSTTFAITNPEAQMTKIRQPQWHLRRACPICQQGGLALVACSECSHVAVICTEEGSAFPNVRTIAPESAVDPNPFAVRNATVRSCALLAWQPPKRS